MIATLDEIKELLGLTGSEYDAQIQAYMPLVQDFIIEFCKNDFASGGLNHTSGTTSFVKADKKIVDEEGTFASDPDLRGSKDIVVSYSLKNNGNFTISPAVEITDTEIVVDEALIDEANEDGFPITIRAVEYPKALKIPYANMIWFKVKTSGSGVGAGGIKSKKLDSFSVEYSTENMQNGYLKTHLQELAPFKKITRY